MAPGPGRRPAPLFCPTAGRQGRSPRRQAGAREEAGRREEREVGQRGGQFGRSAEQLGISQASVSNQIKALEEQLGVTLFDRAPGRRPSLRPAGLAFLEDLRDRKSVV